MYDRFRQPFLTNVGALCNDYPAKSEGQAPPSRWRCEEHQDAPDFSVGEELTQEIVDRFFEGLHIERLGETDAIELEARVREFLNCVSLPLAVLLEHYQDATGVTAAEWLFNYETLSEMTDAQRLALPKARDQRAERDQSDDA